MADAPLEDWFPAKGIKPSYEDQRALTVETGRRIRVLSQGVGEVTDAGMAEVARSGGEFSEELTAQSAVPLVEVGGVYPPRPATAPVAIWVGDTNPEAFMEDADIWVPLTGDAALLDEPALVALLGNPLSDVSLGVKSLAADGGLWLPARPDFRDVGAAVAAVDSYMGAGASTRTPAWIMPNDGTSALAATFRVPDGWTGYTVRMLWMVATTGGAATGVRLKAEYTELVAGASASTTTSIGSTTGTVPSTPQYILNETTIGTPVTATAGTRHRLNISRLGDDAADTYASGSGIGFVGVRVVRA